ncbi:MAG TPA: deoxyuridine 5'-triphosphate nucleotidohydrolase [Candidatus Nanoarchaeia archaeon]|nr:deoxyuridine 5'-triphosphate nucleotidohydrolase [Candidatus Nanoarchaeia archaeon]
MLSKQELIEAQNTRPSLIEQMIDPAVQIQPNGIEMTLQSVHKLQGAGSIAFDNSERTLPDTKNLEFDQDGWLHLGPGIYKIIYNEVVNIPDNIAAIARARSSLLRCGVALETAVWDAGYSGRSESLLVVHNPDGFRIKRDARVVQLIFFKFSSSVDEGYSGIYQNENK